MRPASILLQFRLPPRMQPYPLPITQEQRRKARKRQGNEGKKRIPPPVPQPLVQRVRRQRYHGRAHAADDADRAGRARRVDREAVDDVVLHQHIAQDGADGDDGRAQDGRDPRRPPLQRPPVPQEADGQQQRAEHEGRQAPLGLAGDPRRPRGEHGHAPVRIEADAVRGEHKADGQAEVREARLARGEGLLRLVDGAEGGEYQVHVRVEDGGVDGEERDHGRLEEDFEGALEGGFEREASVGGGKLCCLPP